MAIKGETIKKTIERGAQENYSKTIDLKNTELKALKSKISTYFFK